MDEERIRYSLPDIPMRISTIDMQQGKILRGTHLHNAVEIIRVERGELQCITDEETLTLPAGELLLVNSRVIHRLVPQGAEARFTYMQIDISAYYDTLFPSKFPYLSPFINRQGVKQTGRFKTNDTVGEMFDRIEQEIREQTHAFIPYIRSCVFMLVSGMCRDGYLYDSADKTDKAVKKLLPVIEYVEENFHQKITLDDLSRHIRVDKYNLCKRFKAALGCTITDYINRRRLHHAEELLLTTGKTVTEIAADCGFNSVQYFNLVFKNAKNCSPRHYRHMQHY